MKNKLFLFVLLGLSSFLLAAYTFSALQETPLDLEAFGEELKKGKLPEAQFNLSQDEGIRLYTMLQCALGQPQSGYILYDSATSRKTYSELKALWHTADSLPYYSIEGIRDEAGRIALNCKRTDTTILPADFTAKPAYPEPGIALSLRMDGPFWLPPNAFKIGVVSLNDYFAIGQQPELDSITLIDSTWGTQRHGFRFSDQRGWEYEVRTTKWKGGPIQKIVVQNISEKEALQIIQDYIDYTGFFPSPFFARLSLGESPAKIFKKGELWIVEAYYQSTTPEYRVTFDYVNYGDKAVLTLKTDIGFYMKKGMHKAPALAEGTDKMRDFETLNFTPENWKKYLLRAED